ncbi:MAG: DUF2339 domain-containing protein [Hyphomicrobiaceae bacterium]|nr:DUF2339 domain-containing protein [Hyphomicrobiaceae bacterium]
MYLDDTFFIAALALLAGLALLVVFCVILFNKIRRLEAVSTRLIQDLMRLQMQFSDLQGALRARPDAPAAFRTTDPSQPAAPKPGLVRPATPQAPPPAFQQPQPAPQPIPMQQASGPASPYRGPDAQNHPVVLKRERFAALSAFLRDNWVYVVSAVSLAFAGLFFVQYGIENGLLPPPVRVAMAVLLGAALIATGEWLFRRLGEGSETLGDYLPPVFSGAGLVSIYGGIAAGRLLYALYSDFVAFLGLGLTTLAAIALGWRHGPFLVAIGIIGATAAPYLVDGSGDPGDWLYAYFAAIALAGLAVDSYRRWAWISVLALALPFLGALPVTLSGLMSDAALAGFALAMAALAVLVPRRAVPPDHPGPSLSMRILKTRVWPPFPERLAIGGVAVASAFLALAGSGIEAYAGLAAMTVFLALGTRKADGIGDLGLLPVLAFVALSVLDANRLSLIFNPSALQVSPLTIPAGSAAHLLVLGCAAVMTVALAWRIRPPLDLPVGFGAAVTAPVIAVLLEFLWRPHARFDALTWTLVIAALAGLMAAIALYLIRDGKLRPASWHVLSACSLAALAVFIGAPAAALTIAFAVIVAASAFIDRHFRFPETAWFAQGAAAFVTFRLTVEPGFDFAADGALWLVILVYGAAIASAVIAGRFFRDDARAARGIMESAALGWAALFANALILRFVSNGSAFDALETHWSVALHAFPWLIVALTQLYRMQFGGPLFRFRAVLAAAAGVAFVLLTLFAVLVVNPIFSGGINQLRGPLIADTLLLAYGLPGLLLVAAAWKLAMPGLMRKGIGGVGALLVALYVALEIRRFWHGVDIAGSRVLDGELYSYTAALVLAGGGLLWQAIRLGSETLRRIAMAVIALTIVKVFFWDAGDLAGLTRVLTFLGVGLSLAGLAWLNRWARLQITSRSTPEPQAPAPGNPAPGPNDAPDTPPTNT